jgi:DNA-binding NarL/FixJ family response regulator
MIKILLTEDNEIVRSGLRRLLESKADIEIAAEAANGLQCLDILHSGLPVDVVMADLNMKDLDGIELTRTISALYPDVHVVILTMHDKSVFLRQAQQAGAKGFILKGGDAEELFTVIRTVASGKSYFLRGEEGDTE